MDKLKVLDPGVNGRDIRELAAKWITAAYGISEIEQRTKEIRSGLAGCQKDRDNAASEMVKILSETVHKQVVCVFEAVAVLMSTDGRVEAVPQLQP